MNSLSLRSLMLAAALAATPTFAQSSLQGGFVEGADVMVFVNAQSLNASAFSQAMKKQQSPEMTAKQKEMQAKFNAATGLNEEDVVSLVLSADIDMMNLEEPDPAMIEKLPGLLAVQLAKAVTLEQVAAGLKVVMDEKAESMTLAPATVDGLNVLVIKPSVASEEEGPKQAYCSLSPDGKNVLISLNTASLQSGLARIAAGNVAQPSPDMATAIRTMGNRPLRFALVFPPKMREKIAMGVQEGAAAGGMGAMMMPFATTRSLLISSDVKDNFDLSLQLDVGNPANAQQAAGMMQGMIPMMMMGMGEQLGPNAMSIAQKLKIGAEANVVGLSISLTPADLKVDPNAAPAGMEMPMMDME